MEELILPMYYYKIIEPLSLEEIHNFNYYLLNSFGEEGKEIKKIISQFNNLAEMPIEIMCKYWMRIYTLEKGKFYAILNNGLKQKKFKLFLPYIKMMYEGIKRKVFNSIINQKLYSGGFILNSELEKLRNNLNANEKVIYYFKSFQSFSKDPKQAKRFIKSSRQDTTSLLFTLENYNNNIEGVSNADINEFSIFHEEEVLFFPFSSFEVEKIDNVNDGQKNYVNVTLKYLGKDIPNIKYNIFRDLPKNQFGKDITEMGLIKYKFCKFYEVEKEINIGRNATCLLIFEKNILLLSIGSDLKLYDINENKNILNINIHEGNINDLLKIKKDTFISSSNDETIKFIKLNNKFTSYNLIININYIHSSEINQTIKLKTENLYASCSNDKKAKIWFYELGKENIPKVQFSLINFSEVLSIYELPKSNMITILENGLLIFWDFKNKNYCKDKILKGFKDILHNGIQSINEDVIFVGTKKAVFLIDINLKMKIKRILLNYESFSIGYSNNSIFLGLKHNINSCLLFEYNFEKKYEEFNFECIGKGRDLCKEISSIYQIDEKTIVTSNKYNKIKIWKLTDKKPKLLIREKNPNFNLEEEFDSSEEGFTPGNPDDNDNNSNYLIKNDDDNKEGNEENKNNINNDINNKKEEINSSLSKLKITFIFNGQKANLEYDSEMTVEQLINIYNKKFCNNIINNNYFIYNGQKLDIKDKRKIKDVLANNSIILVNKK